MIYKAFHNLQLSQLGLGNMRLPTTGEQGPIDEKKARELIEYAYEQGVNYFDTAYRYHNGESELVVGKVLGQFPRDSWYLATKMPGHMMSYRNGKLQLLGYLAGHTISSPVDIFEDQLKKCGVDYFDFYLLHNLCETAYDFYTDEELGVVEYLLEQRNKGRIRHLGFSAHGRADTIKKFLDWKDCFEFVQIQLNYMDWILQEADKKYEVITNHGIPVIVMEPVRGGKLASPGGAANSMLKKERPRDSIASWAFRFLQSLPNVLVVLSGMSTMEQLKENIGIFSRFDPATDTEKELLKRVVATMVDMIPCTACRYCCEECPRGLNIPKLISLYNEMRFDNPSILRFTLDAMTEEELPAACIACGVCAKLCPQGIKIPEVMKKFALALANR
ncbi:MAG: aldo/keto reductase [Treponema sp.]|jgi:predicted aldo/keto reductase-like oxidoreductase|nr:aldo/keto reductase [Treponema sp.]